MFAGLDKVAKVRLRILDGHVLACKEIGNLRTVFLALHKYFARLGFFLHTADELRQTNQ